MTKEEIVSKIVWDSYDVGKIPLFVPVFGMEINFQLFTQNKSISDKMFTTLQEVCNLPESSVEQIKDLLWEEADFSFTVSDYGCEPLHNETLKQAHFREFGLTDKEVTYHKCTVDCIQISDETENYSDRFAEIKIDTATDNFISIIVKNGNIIDYDDDGTHLGWFVETENYAHLKRQKLLKE